MKTTEYIRMALDNSNGWFQTLINDIKDAPLTAPTPNGGNHPLWILGHLIYSDSNLLDVFILGGENRFPELAHCAAGQSVSPNADDYPSFDDLLSKHQQMREAALAHLETLSDDDLDQKSHGPEEYAQFFGTVGACYAAMTSHMAFHNGQVADARRAAGREPLMV